MGYACYYVHNHDRHCGYAVPAVCEHPDCNEEIDRGLSYVCGDEPGGGEYGCGLYFCSRHMTGYRKPRGSDRYHQFCKRCHNYRSPFKPKPELREWMHWILKHPSWKDWRDENPQKVEEYRSSVYGEKSHV